MEQYNMNLNFQGKHSWGTAMMCHIEFKWVNLRVKMQVTQGWMTKKLSMEDEKPLMCWKGDQCFSLFSVDYMILSDVQIKCFQIMR